MRVAGRRTLVWRAVLIAVLVVAAAELFVAHLQGGPGISDTGVYQGYGERIVGGDLPYRDFAVEYPPGALVPFVLPALVSESRGAYDAAFLVLMLVALAALAALLVVSLDALDASAPRVAASVSAFLLGVALLGPFVLTRFDLYAAAVTLAAICAILRGRDRLGSVLLGVAIATKIYPAVLLPLLVTRVWRREGPAAALRGLGLTAGTAFAIYLPFAILAPEGVARSVWRQAGRPLQIESLGSGVLLALHHAAGMPLAWASSSGSQNLTGTAAAVASALTTLVGLAALALVWLRFARGDTESAARFAQYGAAAIVAFVAFGKVASPQFLVWLLAIVVLVPGRRGLAASGLLLAACVLTRMWFPRSYRDLVKQFDPTASWLVLARDILLVAVFVVLIARVRAREPGPA
jgi:uncharacterized membrane protein